MKITTLSDLKNAVVSLPDMSERQAESDLIALIRRREIVMKALQEYYNVAVDFVGLGYKEEWSSTELKHFHKVGEKFTSSIAELIVP